MQVLIAAVETGSLPAASRRLGTPLATVTRKVSELESHLRTRLPTRTRRGLTLTDAARCYVAARKRILEQAGEAERTDSNIAAFSQVGSQRALVAAVFWERDQPQWVDSVEKLE